MSMTESELSSNESGEVGLIFGAIYGPSDRVHSWRSGEVLMRMMSCRRLYS